MPAMTAPMGNVMTDGFFLLILPLLVGPPQADVRPGPGVGPGPGILPGNGIDIQPGPPIEPGPPFIHDPFAFRVRR